MAEIYYKNVGVAPKTFYGVTFNPGDVKAVSNYINDKKLVRVSKPLTVEPAKVEVKKPTKVDSRQSKSEQDEKLAQENNKEE